MNRTGIEYLDLTWNPTAGCSGHGCAVSRHCWAFKMAKRLGRFCSTCPSFAPHVHFDRFDEPLMRKKPAIIGTSFMGEFFDEGISEWVRTRIKMTMEKAHQHTFVVFTKQPQNIELDEPYPPNMWIGVSVNLEKDLWRLDVLRGVPIKVRIASFEPLLEDLGELDLSDFGWVIVGAQTRPEIQPKFSWVANIFDATGDAQIPLFTKNNLRLNRVVQQYPQVA